MLRSVRVWCCLVGSVPGVLVGRPVRRCGLFPEGSVEVVLESLGCLGLESREDEINCEHPGYK